MRRFPTDNPGGDNAPRGFTLIELLVVITIMVIMTAGAMVVIRTMLSSTVLSHTGSVFANYFDMANLKAIQQKAPHMVVINRGDGTIRLFSSGPDQRFSMGEDDSEQDSVQHYALDDVELRLEELVLISKEVVVMRALILGGVTKDDIPSRVREDRSAAFVFTDKGVRYGLIDVTVDARFRFVELSNALPSSPELYEEKVQADIVLAIRGGEEQLWMNVDSITGSSYRKLIHVDALSTDDSGSL